MTAFVGKRPLPQGLGPAGAKSSRSVESDEGDWTCPDCGNVNFGNRLVCNMRKCGTAKPAAQAAPWNCIGCGNENFANRLFCNMRRCQLAKPGLTAANLTAAVAQAAQQSVQERPFQAPPKPVQYPFQPFQGPGLAKPAFSASQPPFDSPLRNSERPAPIGSWTCLACGNVNFPNRTTCNSLRCRRPREEVDGGESIEPRAPVRSNLRPTPAPMVVMSSRVQSRVESSSAPPGSWRCSACSNVNYPSRTTCNANSCGRPRDEVEVVPSREPAEAPSGSWTCPGCQNVNYPNRTNCNKRTCNLPRPDVF